MNDFLDRLKEEKSELNLKMDSLRKFMDSDKFAEIDNVQMTLINVQLSAMETYSQCLLERIVRLDITN